MGRVTLDILVAILGASLGSFVGCCAYRIPQGISIVNRGSFCDTCGRTLRWHELIPVVGYLSRRGKCTTCHEQIRIYYLFLEIFGGVIALLVTSYFGFTIRSASVLTFMMIMLLVALIDWRHLLIPNVVVACVLILALALKAQAGKWELISAGVSGISAFLFMGAVRFGARKLLKKEAMGLGDVKLSAVIGASIGFEAFLITLWVSSMAGAAYGVYLSRARQAELRDERIPFGTFLSLASAVAIFINLGAFNG